MLVLAIIPAAEFGLRLAGATSFPLYRVDSAIGYYPAPSQQGALFRRNDWAVNAQSMGTARPFSPTADAVLLVGDSIVFGGNPFRQKDKLGPQLEQVAKVPVYPLAAGGWSLNNELAMMRAHPEWLATPTIVWVSESGDFGELATHSSALQWPDHPPVSALAYYAQKYVLKPKDVVMSPVTAEATRRWQANLDWFLQHYHGRLIWVLYPLRKEVGQPLPAAFAPLLARLQGRAEIVTIARDPLWKDALYRDTEIHPSVEGNRVLAEIIARHLR
ncbi:SGNH/GDSL hydrolase family protein [Novosphingobium umbonatum]|uniref:SGNH/GDSL hydrolase family protein n=1 Tax=Novosphingobium umbonatum TaxID=1908524 RepID=A0A437N2W9_9SPHN|nr:SGNH/GDSL hydrolase family protein [Novosphingobium umbonatum]RVU04263.1 SGNH/GDSL hydrolase family protein [Novosphingobium umbonatum]